MTIISQGSERHKHAHLHFMLILFGKAVKHQHPSVCEHKRECERVSGPNFLTCQVLFIFHRYESCSGGSSAEWSLAVAATKSSNLILNLTLTLYLTLTTLLTLLPNLK